MTRHGRRRSFLFVLLACALVAPDPAGSHEFAMKSVVNAFIKIDAREAHLVVRVPIHVLGEVKFPLSGREIVLGSAGPALESALRVIARDLTVSEEGRPLVPSSAAGRLSLPSNRAFDRYDDAVAQVALPADPGTAIFSDQAYVDAHFIYPIASPASRFAIRTELAPELKDYLKLAIRYLPLGERGRPLVITSRSGNVPLNPAWYQAASGFVALGFEHILGGTDHLLFLLCLLIPVLSLRQVVSIVTAFTVAHSVTLIGSAYDLGPSGAWFPPFVETAIAASIVYMALENIIGANLRRRWVITGLFGLVHGFGFSYGLKESLQFAGRHLLVSLFSFNVGIELGQLAVLALVLPALALLRRHAMAGRAGGIVLSALIAHTGWHWMSERAEILWKVPWPTMDAANVASLARWVAAALLAAAAVRFLAKRAEARRLARSRTT